MTVVSGLEHYSMFSLVIVRWRHGCMRAGESLGLVAAGRWAELGYVSLLSSELCALALSCYLSEPQFSHL